jgi:competence protein ComEA
MPPWLERNAFLVIAFAGVLLLAGLFVGGSLRSDEAPLLVLHDSGLQPGAPIRVHVTGAVTSPGVYELAAGDRVEDALAAAGGATAGADIETINLARRLRDGEQILVEGPAAQAAPVRGAGELLDLNTATVGQLDALPGIGEAYSQRILDSRAVDGPFTSVDDLLLRDVLPERVLEGIRALVTVIQP